MNNFDRLLTVADLENLLHLLRASSRESVSTNVEGEQAIDFFDNSYFDERADDQRLGSHLSGFSESLSESFDAFRSIEATSHQRELALRILNELVREEFVERIHTIDFTLELRKRYLLASPQENARLYYYLISMADKSGGLDRENHGSGYHFHYIDTSRKRPERTNVLFTFNPKQIGPPHDIFWELHGPGIKTIAPSNWGQKRVRAVRSATKASLLNPGKDKFKIPKYGSDFLKWK